MPLRASPRVCTPVASRTSDGEIPTCAGRVLFVSADADLRVVVTRVLEHEGLRVQAVSHSGHALLLCRTADFDVLVAELCGPDLSGPALAEQIRRHCPKVAAVYLSNPGTSDGIANVIVRPFTRDDLVERIRMITG